MMSDEPMYDEWLAKRQSAKPPNRLTDRVMASLESRETQTTRQVRLADRINESQSARCAACVAALLVGSLPFLFVASYMTQLVKL